MKKILFIILLFASCKKENPQPIIPVDTCHKHNVTISISVQTTDRVDILISNKMYGTLNTLYTYNSVTNNFTTSFEAPACTCETGKSEIGQYTIDGRSDSPFTLTAKINNSIITKKATNLTEQLMDAKIVLGGCY